MIYFVAQKDKIKIGTTNNINQRLKNLSTSSPHPLVLLATMDGDKEIEKQLHFRFHKYKVCREWFSCSEEIKQFINENNELYYCEFEDGVIKRYNKMRK